MLRSTIRCPGVNTTYMELFTRGQTTCYCPRKMLLSRRQTTHRKLCFYYTCKFGVISIINTWPFSYCPCHQPSTDIVPRGRYQGLVLIARAIWKRSCINLWISISTLLNMTQSQNIVSVFDIIYNYHLCWSVLYIISNIFAKPQVFYHLSDAKIFDIIYLLSPLLECKPTVTPCLLSVESKEAIIIGKTWGSRGNFLGISLRAVDLTMRPYNLSIRWVNHPTNG
jgi:hypothetical protein